jgi:hypothetical protein
MQMMNRITPSFYKYNTYPRRYLLSHRAGWAGPDALFFSRRVRSMVRGGVLVLDMRTVRETS